MTLRNLVATPPYKWSPINDLPSNPDALGSSELKVLQQIWIEQKESLEATGAVKEFNERLQRQWAIETGIIERLYTLDRGVTQMLIERGIDASLIPFTATNKNPELVAQIIQDQKLAVESLFDFVKGHRPLSTSYIKELHALLTRHQSTTTAIDQFGALHEVPLIRGDYKKLPNNPQRPDGAIHEYCPPEHVAAEMDRLIGYHKAHEQDHVPTDVEAAWLHHAFTQIHPFQDGNGRVARALASLVFIKGGWFPLTLTRDDRTAYIEALEHADDADLMALLTLFGTIQKRTFVKILGIAGQVRQRDTVDQVIGAAKDLLAKRQRTLLQQYERAKETADLLRARAAERFGAIATKLAGELGRIHEEYRFSVDSEPNDGARRHYFRFQVIENARTLDYFANLSEYHAWTRLVLRTDTQAEVLLSFHGIGHEYRGVLAATLSFFRREETEDGERQISDIVPASHAIFQVNYRELDKEAERRFDEWLEPALVNALEIWRATL